MAGGLQRAVWYIGVTEFLIYFIFILFILVNILAYVFDNVSVYNF